ncbi:uncharacterized protein LOC143214757 isoform X2 [Lasioglossum baleicum]|uniref:uncharacterized protein LOC143214757 isoform X2 n=1 Tax=Lasioglossum baleicum TaxID=434251 RepID=UPI003FCCAED4
MSDSDNKDVPNVLEAFTSLLDRLDHDFNPSDSSIIQPTIDRLGDNKDAMMAHLLLLKIMEKGWMTPKQLLDRLRPALVDENAKLVEEALILLTATVKKFDPDKTISTDLLAEVVKVISSNTSESVQEAGRKLLKCLLSTEVQGDHPEVQVDHPEVQVDHPDVQVDHPEATTPSLPLTTPSAVDHSVVEEDKVDIEEIIENCINPEWRERKKNLKEMEKILIEGHILTQTQLGKLKSNLSKLFEEQRKQVFTSLLDVIKALVTTYHDDLDDWIDTVCTWLFGKFCKENVKSIEEKIKGVLDVIRECLPGDQLLLVAMRCLNDPTLCRPSSIGGRVAVLKFIQQIIETVDPCLPVESARAALVPLASLLGDDNLDIKKHAQSCIVSLYNLHPQEMAGSSQGPSKSIVPTPTKQAVKPLPPSKGPSKTIPASTNQLAKPPAPPEVSSSSNVLAPITQAAKPPAPSEASSSSNVPASPKQPAKRLTRCPTYSDSYVPPSNNQDAKPVPEASLGPIVPRSAWDDDPSDRHAVAPRPNVRAPNMWPGESFDPYGGSSMSNFPASAYQALYQMASCQMAQRFNVSTSPYEGMQRAPPRMATRSFVRCGCKRCNCSTNHCTCRKNGARCGSDCDCVGCCN